MEEKDEFFGENDVQRDPAPTVSRPKKRKWVSVTLAIGLVLVSFFGGFFTRWYSLDEGIRTLSKIKSSIDDYYYKEVDDDEFYATLFQAVNTEILDDYSYYMTAEEYNESLQGMKGNKSGIGLVFARDIETGVTSMTVHRVAGNSPAESAGICVGDEIVGFGKTQDGIQASSSFDEFSAFLSGIAENVQFFLKLRSLDGERTVPVTRSAYVESYVFYKTSTASYGFVGENAETFKETGKPLTALDNDTAYIRLLQFSGNAKEGFATAMAQFKKDGKTHLVLDLRGNGGGYLDVMQSISAYFCKNTTDKKPVVAIADFGDSETLYRADGNVYGEYFSQESKIYALVDGDTASASECLLGAMLDYGAMDFQNVCLVGEDGRYKSFGKGIMQETRAVSPFKGDALKLTTAEILWPKSKRSIHGRGILPEDGALGLEKDADFDKTTASAIALLTGAGTR